MKVFTFVFICFMSSSVFAQSTEPKTSDPRVSDLGWMTGCWAQKGKDQDSFISEIWTKPFDLMLGTNRSVREGKVRAFEYMRIESRDSSIYFVAKPSGASGETSFKLISLEKNKVIFENKEHDFPKRVIYSKKDDDLAARVEDDTNGIEFLFKKTDCDE